jgi:cytochrome oxidase assembly protein ShyY1
MTVANKRKLPRWAFVFRPGWLALAVVVLAFAYLCFTVLAPWQLGKNTETSRENAQISSSLKSDAVPVTEVLPDQDSSAPDEQWRRVTATGRYLPDAQVLARLRVIDAEPAFEVLVPFQVDGGPVVLVDRGYVRPVNGSQVPSIPALPTGTVTIAARLRDPESVVTGKEPFRADGTQQVYSINTGQIADLTGVRLAGSYLQLVEDQPGGLGVIGLPHLDAGPFLSYGIQWIAFGILAPIGLGYFVYSELRQRRIERLAETARAEASESAPAEPPTTEEKLADRYGRRR